MPKKFGYYIVNDPLLPELWLGRTSDVFTVDEFNEANILPHYTITGVNYVTVHNLGGDDELS